MKVPVKKLDKTAIVPKYATENAAGFDLQTIHFFTLLPGERRLIGTGLAFEIPVGYELQIRPRSGLAFKNGLTVLNSPGTIDADYRGEVKVLLLNTGNETLFFNKGDRIAQGVIAEYKKVSLEETDELSETERGAGGFGHTGVSE